MPNNLSRFTHHKRNFFAARFDARIALKPMPQSNLRLITALHGGDALMHLMRDSLDALIRWMH